MSARYCLHRWGPPILVGRYDARWLCDHCGEMRTLSGDKPPPGTFFAATEDFGNALRNLGLAIRDTLPGPLQRLLTRATPRA